MKLCFGDVVVTVENKSKTNRGGRSDLFLRNRSLNFAKPIGKKQLWLPCSPGAEVTQVLLIADTT